MLRSKTAARRYASIAQTGGAAGGKSMTDANTTPRSPARTALDAYQLQTDRFHAQLGSVAGQGASLGVVAGGDIAAIAFTVMIEAARASQDDLRAIMGDIKAINAAKAGVRKLLDTGKPGRAPNGTVFDAEASVQLAATIAVAEITDEVRDVLRAKRDSLDEMSEMDMLRLQMAMDRVSKMMSTLSNLLKTLADTQAAIVQNLK
jgi:hypothetical protein